MGTLGAVEMNKDELIKLYVELMYSRMDEMRIAYPQKNNQSRKDMEDGYRYAVMNGTAVISSLLNEAVQQPEVVTKKEDDIKKKSQLSTNMERAGKDIMKFLTG